MASTSRSGPPSRRSTMAYVDDVLSRRDTVTQVTAKYYAPQTHHLSTAAQHRNFLRTVKASGSVKPNVAIGNDELRRFSMVQVKFHLL